MCQQAGDFTPQCRASAWFFVCVTTRWRCGNIEKKKERQASWAATWIFEFSALQTNVFCCFFCFFLFREAQWTNLIGPSLLVGKGGGDSDPAVRKTLAELNVRHSTFGICLQEHLHVGRGDVSLLVFVPAHPRPAVAFVFFYDVQQLALRHGDGAFIMTWGPDSSISTARSK